jgi:hypothetical protein
MEQKDDDKRKKEKRTPIIDGDARPDMNVHGEEQNEAKGHPIEIPKKKTATTRNRNDKNSLEDYKDAKLD